MAQVRKRVLFVTGNPGKALEVNRVLGETFKVDNLSVDVEEIQGSEEEIAISKCRRASEMGSVQQPIFTEDVSLRFHALEGLPGPYIKWFWSSLGCEGLHKMLLGFENKKATAVCTYAFCAGPGQEPIVFQGTAEGTIVAPRTVRNFGWDPIFQPDGHDLTYDEMDLDEKNKISHRGKGLAKLREFLLENASLLPDAEEDEEEA